MSSLHITDLSIKGFRGLKDLSISGLGRVTLITGRNNTGKSSVLEALGLFANNASRASVIDILASREEYRRWNHEDGLPSEGEGVLLISQLFHGFPQNRQDFVPIEITTNGKTVTKRLAMRVSWNPGDLYAYGRQRRLPNLLESDGEVDSVVVLFVETEGYVRPQLLEDFLWGSRLSRSLPASYGRLPSRLRTTDKESTVRMPCMLAGPYSGERTGELGTLWDGVTLTDEEPAVVDALQIIDSNISAVSMVESDSYGRGRKAVVRAKSISRPVPLRTFGDGANRVFALALALVNARGGLLLIDEFENGLHHTVQTDIWHMVFRLARQLDVQVFATTHSRDAVAAFQKAASESPEEGVLLRLTRKGEDIVPTVASEDELAIATRHDIEVR